MTPPVDTPHRPRPSQTRTAPNWTAQARTPQARTPQQPQAQNPRRREAAAPAQGRPVPARGGGHRPPPRGPRPPQRRPGRPLGRSGPRLGLSLLGMVALLAVLGGRLVWLQAVDAGSYAAQAESQRTREITLVAPRGDITDRNGATLATTVMARAVSADPALVTDPAATARALAPLLDVDVATLTEKLSREKRFVYLARGVEVAQGDAIRSLKLPGVSVVRESKRIHPGGTLAANVIGFTNTDGKGLAGLESSLESSLSGVDGVERMEVDREGRQIPAGVHSETAPTPGKAVRLTIDRDIQWMAQQRLVEAVAESRAASGTVIVMDPRTGEVLALATEPTVDADRPGIGTDAARGNPAITDVYEPGSVNKIITVAAALEAGVATPDTPFTVPNRYEVAGKKFRDSHEHATEHLTFTGVLATSSNIGTIQAYQKLGDAKMFSALQDFGFGRRTGIGLPGESAGLLPGRESWSGTTGPTLSFGQGLSVTPIQVASVFSTIANDGVRVAPRIVAEGGPTALIKAEPDRVVSARTAQQVRLMLEAVTSDEGTAPAARIAGYRVAGKTGTSQRVDPECNCYRGYTASFVGMAPADDPRLVVAVIVQDPKNGYYGGTIAAPVFHDVMSFALQTGEIPPTGTTAPTARLTVG